MKRHVSIHLTPYAPGVSATAIGDQRRWISMWSVTPAQALGALCDRLKVAPLGVTVRDNQAAGDIELHGVSEHAPGRVLLAMVNYGLTASEITETLQALATARAAA